MYYDESKAYADLCERLYGKNLLQMGMGTFDEIDILLENMRIDPSEKVLDIGCCFGRLTEYLCNKTGADFTGIDINEADLSIAKKLERGNLHFMLADMSKLPFKEAGFDKIISMDSLYYVENLNETLDGLLRLLSPGGMLGIFWSQPPRIKMDAVSPENTEIGKWAVSRGLPFKTVDRINEHMAFWKKSKQLYIEMEDAFKNEGMGYHWESQMKEQNQVEPLALAGRFPRWLFFIENVG